MASADFTIADVLAWARTKPADERYNYCDARNCGVAQFGRETGRPHLLDIGLLGEVYPDLDKAASGPEESGDWQSFGDFVARLEKLCPETVVTPSEWTRLDAYLTDIEAVESVPA